MDADGPFIRLWGVNSSQLPAEGATGDELIPFLSSILREAVPIFDGLPSETSPSAPSWQPKAAKSFGNSIAPVHMYERVISPEALRGILSSAQPPGVSASDVRAETWALRRSVHEDSASKGTASWGEFVMSFKINHAYAEACFTPTIKSVAHFPVWNCAGVEIEAGGTTWTDVTLSCDKSIHKLPMPLSQRRFPVVQITAAAQGRQEFVVVQIALQRDAEEEQTPGVVPGAYTSVERVRKLGGDGRIEWTMGTVSDAHGVLPAWVQRMAVPGQIAKDVDLFMGWIATEREKADGFLQDGTRDILGPQAGEPSVGE